MKKLSTIQIIVGLIVFILIASVIWYFVSGRKPATATPSQGGTPVPTPKGVITPVVVKGFAKAKYPTTVYNENFTVYYEAKQNDLLGDILGYDGAWTIIGTSTGHKYVYTTNVTII